MNNWFKRNWLHLAAIGIFLALTYVYLSPLLEGKLPALNDIMQASAMQKEVMANKKADGTGPLWTNQMFGGMPSYQIWIQYPGSISTYINQVINAVFASPANIVFLYLLCAYILLTVMELPFWLCLIGAIGMAFTSYNFIIIEAGHINKAAAIAYFPLVMAGFVLAYRKKYVLGGLITALALAMELRSSHLQMTYYLFLALGLFILMQAWIAFKEKAWNDFLKGTLAIGLGIVLGIGTNITNLLINNEYAKETIRGGTELTLTESDKKVSKGLDKDYAYQWSEGPIECFSFLVPNAVGGGSGTPLPDDAKSVKLLSDRGVQKSQAQSYLSQFSYWGPKPFTSGSYYFGIIILFFFILGLFIVNKPIKWWILTAVSFSILLSFGKYFQSFSDLFFDHFPMYNKFRAVESILVIAGFLIPLLAVLTIQEILTRIDQRKEILKLSLRTFYVLGGLLVLIYLLPSLFLSFASENDGNIRNQMEQMSGGDAGFAGQLIDAIQSDRASLAQNDALRSIAFVALAMGLLFLFLKDKLKKEYLLAGLAVLILVDMWSVDKRYLNSDAFMAKGKRKNYFQARPADEQILQDTDPNYRVFDATISTYNSASTSYFHKTIGGYHAAKLRRMQDIIEHQLAGDSLNRAVLNMLNAKYFIVPGADKQPQAVRNPDALGNCWFVSNVKYVKGANEEMQALTGLEPTVQAVVDERFKSALTATGFNPDSGASIRLTNYVPDHLTYESNSKEKSLAVFSEVYYEKGWNAYIDGQLTPHLRADYILRALEIPAGKHKIEFIFEPSSYKTGETIAGISSIILLLGIGFVGFQSIRSARKEQQA